MLLVGTGRAVCMASSSLVTYPAPEGVDLNDDFTVQVRQDGGEWKTLPSYLVKVDEVRDTKHCVEDASMAIFDFSGKVDVKAVYNKGKVNTARVRPLSYDIPCRVEGNAVCFELTRPCNVSVEVNGDISTTYICLPIRWRRMYRIKTTRMYYIMARACIRRRTGN